MGGGQGGGVRGHSGAGEEQAHWWGGGEIGGEDLTSYYVGSKFLSGSSMEQPLAALVSSDLGHLQKWPTSE